MSQTDGSHDRAQFPDLAAVDRAVSPAVSQGPALGDQGPAQGAARFRALVEHAADALLLLDADGVVGYASPAVARLGGYRPEALIGRSACALAHPEDLPRLRALHAQVRAAPGEVVAFTLRARHRDGSWRHLEGSARNLLADPAVGGMVVTCHDTTEWRRAEAALRRQHAYTAALHDTTLALLGQRDPAALLEAIVARAAALAGTPHGYLYLVREDEDALELVVGLGHSAPYVGHRMARGESVAGRVWASGQSLAVTDYRSWPGRPRRIPGVTYRAVVGVPLVAGGAVAGVIGLASTEAGRQFDAAQLALLGQFAELAALALENARLHEARREGEERARGLAAAAFEAIALHDRGTILEVNPAFAALAGCPPEDIIGRSVLDFAAPDSHAAIRQHIAAQSEAPYEVVGLKADGTRFPVELRGKAVPYRGRTVRATAIRDLSERKRAELELGLLHALQAAIGAARDLRAALAVALFGVCEAAGWALGQAWLPRADGRTLECSPAWYARADGLASFRAASAGLALAPGEGLPGRARATKRPVWARNPARELAVPLRRAAQEAELRAGLAFPVLDGGEVVAVLEFFVREERAEDAGLIAFVATVAAQLGAVMQRQRAEEALRASEERHRTVFAAAPVGIVTLDPAGRVLEANRAFERLLGYTTAELRDLGARAIIHPEDLDEGRRLFDELRAGRRERYAREARSYRKDGGLVWLRTTVAAVRDEGGRLRYAVSMDEDVTARRAAEAALRASEARLAEAQRIARLGSWEWDLATPEVRWSDEMYRLYGVDPQAFAPTAEAIQRRIHPDDRDAVVRAIEAAVASGQRYDLEHRVVRPDGAVRVVQSRGQAVLGEAGRPVRMVGTAHDITARKGLEERLAHRAFHDPLTDLPNRALFMDRLAQALAAAQRHGEQVAVLFVDLDRFKAVNDQLGHEVGDQLLIAVGERLRGCVRPGDTVSRLGGDEFTVLLVGLGDEGEATAVAERILHELGAPYPLGDQPVQLSTSVGIALSATGADVPAELLRRADAAMYRAKRGGKARYALYDAGTNGAARRRLALEADLRQALDRGGLQVHYQPQVALASGRVVGFEALARWQHPRHGLLLPEDFIPLAEETGLIRPLGRWVLAEACRQARRWGARHPGTSAPVLSVNLSAAQLHEPALAAEVEQALRAAGVAPGQLGLELTESMLLEGAPHTLVALAQLKALGVRLALDDFGTGYASFAYLKRFPVDTLKLDRSFVAGLGRDPGDTAIVRAMVTMAHALGQRVTAEGVERAEQVAELRALGCDTGQGYYFAAPLAGAAAGALLGQPAPPWGTAGAQG